MKDVLLIYVFGSLLALIILKFYSDKDVDEKTGEKGASPNMELVFWSIFLSWISVILGLILIVHNYRERKKSEASN